MFYILVTINVYFFQCWIPNYRILCNYIHIRFFKLGSFNLFLLYRGLWNTKEIRFFSSINGLSTKWEHHLFLRVPKLNISIWESAKNYTHQYQIQALSLPNENRQNIPTPKFPNLRYIMHGLTFAIFQSYWDTGRYGRQNYT